jgi:hypothetical protein
MAADFAAEIAAGNVVVIEVGSMVAGYMIAWPRHPSAGRYRRLDAVTERHDELLGTGFIF